MANPKKWLIQNIVPSPGRLLPLFAPPRHWHTKSYWVEEVGSIVPLLATFSCLSYFLQVFVSHTAPTRHGPRQTNGWSSQRWRKRLRSEMGHVARKPKAVLWRMPSSGIVILFAYGWQKLCTVQYIQKTSSDLDRSADRYHTFTHVWNLNQQNAKVLCTEYLLFT